MQLFFKQKSLNGLLFSIIELKILTQDNLRNSLALYSFISLINILIIVSSFKIVDDSEFPIIKLKNTIVFSVHLGDYNSSLSYITSSLVTSY